MGCGASAGMLGARHPEAAFMVAERDGIEELNDVFEIAPLTSVSQTGIDQLTSADANLFGAYQSIASVKDGKVSVEIVSPRSQTKNVVIAVVDGGAKGKGIAIKDKRIYEQLGDEFKSAMKAFDAQIQLFNRILADYRMNVQIEANRVTPPSKAYIPNDESEMAKFHAVVEAVKNFNSAYYPVKKGLAKASFKLWRAKLS